MFARFDFVGPNQSITDPVTAIQSVVVGCFLLMAFCFAYAGTTVVCEIACDAMGPAVGDWDSIYKGLSLGTVAFGFVSLFVAVPVSVAASSVTTVVVVLVVFG